MALLVMCHLQNLQIHHKQYRCRFGNDPEQNLIKLCADCHSLAHYCKAQLTQSPFWPCTVPY